MNAIETQTNLLSVRQTGMANKLENIQGVSIADESRTLSFSKILIDSNIIACSSIGYTTGRNPDASFCLINQMKLKILNNYYPKPPCLCRRCGNYSILNFKHMKTFINQTFLP